MKLSIRIVTLIFFVVAPNCFAQVTVVTGTVTDTNGVPYAGASIKAQLVLAGASVTGQPTVTVTGAQTCRSSGFGSSPCQVPFQGTAGPFTLDSAGSFSQTLQDNALVTPAGTQWLVSVTISPGVSPPLGTGPQACTATITITGASQSVSSSFSACPALSNFSTSPNSVPSIFQIPQNGLLADFQMRSSDSPCSLKDYSGSGNNATGCVGTSPTIIATTGGLQFNANGAISLPTPLRSALSIVVFCGFQGVGTSQNTYALIDGSTAGGANVTRFALDNWATTTTLQPSTLINNYRFRVTSNSSETMTTGPMDVINGVQTLTLTMDTANHVYINGTEVKDYGSGTVFSSAGFFTTGNPQLGGNGTNTTYFLGQMYRALFYNRVLTAAEVQLIAAANTEYGNAHGISTVSVATGLSATQNRLIFVGDSITRGFGVTNPWTGLVNTGANFNTPVSQSITGALASQIVASESFSLFPFFNVNTTKDAAVLWAGTNDFIGGATAAQIQGYNAGFCRNAHTVIFRCGLITMLSRTGNDANKNLLNPLLRNELGQSADFTIDIGGTTQLGADAANAGAAFQGDHIHPTEGSTWNVVSTLVTQGVNRAYGNQNFTSANTYVAAAAAATATTGGSESGNVITITFAANNPCLYGRQCTCTGITPAGYNGLWFPATGSSVNNLIVFSDTTGLGAVSVQGTCSIPQMQDADKYVILNFGAGNYTLETCQGYTGQNIYIKNINAVASTVVSFPGVTGGFPGTTWAAETIDGAANISVAQNAMLVLQSQLISQAAGGCTWKKLQNN